MSLLRFDEIRLEFGEQIILRDAELAIEPGERICLIGRNGAGKSTTLKLITGEIEPDHGEIVTQTGLVVSELRQDLPEGEACSVRDHIRAGLRELDELMNRYQDMSGQDLDAHRLADLEKLHSEIDALDGWHIEQRVEAIITDLELPAHKQMSELSGGWRRRVALARALVRGPDLLLLDEPTNHLDIATIKWLEDRIYSFPGAVLFITHDRAFLQRLATRIIEIDRGHLSSWPGDYQNFLRRKEKLLEDEEAANARFDKKLGQEEIWVRQGIKARRTRNEGRVRSLEKMREEFGKRLKQENQARMHIEEAEQSGRKVIRAKNVAYSYGTDKVIDDFSLSVMRGDRIGFIGNNGVGKTTLLRLLLGELEPQAGTVKLGTNLVIGYFDQLRQTLELDKSVAYNVGEGRTYINMNGKDRHIVGYLKGFLFSPKRSNTPVKSLSGGERNRVILAKLFTRPANLLVLDEPTNDLDIETLEVLEQKLAEFSGTLIVVSHDREFLDNVVTSTIVFESHGGIRKHVGNYSDWARQGHQLAETDTQATSSSTAASGKKAPDSKAARSRSKKLSYNEQRELAALPEAIAAIESNIEALQAKTSTSSFYAQDAAEVKATLQELSAAQDQLEQYIERWGELESRQSSGQSS